MESQAQNAGLLVCLIEPHPLVETFLIGLLEGDSSIRVRQIQDLERKEGKHGAPVFLVDNCSLPLPLSECLRRLRFRHPEGKFVILGRELPREELLRLLWIKVDGFVSYAEVAHSLLRAIHSVAEGNVWIPRDVLRDYVHLGSSLAQEERPDVERLTAREAQIIELVKRRLSNKEVGEILKIRESTVKFHLSNIYSKLQVSSRHDLLANSTDHRASSILSTIFAPAASKM